MAVAFPDLLSSLLEPVAASLDVDPAVLVPPVEVVPAPATTPDFDDLDLDILPVAPDPFGSIGDSACLVTSVAIPLPTLPLGLLEAAAPTPPAALPPSPPLPVLADPPS